MKTISISEATYERLKWLKEHPRETFSEVIDRISPARTVDELIVKMKPFEGIGAGGPWKAPRRRK
ncbi:MAG: antitoxin VapB family protein [Opitutaceae bacterium]|jgi:predicted CopG family antitoxin|nr:antitoxin VapB family protein [Opitutaceae bacterium]